MFENATTIRFDDSSYTVMIGNVGLDEAELKVTNGACFDSSSDDGYEPIC